MSDEGASGAGRPRSNWAQIVSALAALVALVVVSTQIYFLQANTRHANARQVYMSYAEAMLRYPEYAEPVFEEIKKDRLKFVQYQAYVARMLFAYDEILDIEQSPEWLASFKWEISDHKAYFCEENRPGIFDMYYKRMRALIEQFKRENCKPAPKAD